MNSLKFKEYKNPKIYFIGVLITIFGTLISIINLFGLVIILIGILFLFLNTEIEIAKNFNNKFNITLFSKTIFSFEKKLVQPNYISLFGQSFSGSNEYGLISSLGSDYTYDFYVIRFFDENNRNETVFKSKNKLEVLQKAKQLSELLNVDLINKLED